MPGNVRFSDFSVRQAVARHQRERLLLALALQLALRRRFNLRGPWGRHRHSRASCPEMSAFLIFSSGRQAVARHQRERLLLALALQLALLISASRAANAMAYPM